MKMSSGNDLFVNLLPDNSLDIQSSRTNLDRRRPGVGGGALFNHQGRRSLWDSGTYPRNIYEGGASMVMYSLIF